MTLHESNVAQAEMIRQSAVAQLQAEAANFGWLTVQGVNYGGPSNFNLQAAQRATDVAYFRACIASALSNGISPAPYLSALKERYGLGLYA